MTITMAQLILDTREEQAVLDVLRSGRLAQGPQVAQLEETFRNASRAKHCVAVGNGTQALHTALLAHGVGPGDEVITTSFSFIATVTSILMCGATPVFADIEPDTFNIDASKVAEKITSKTKAIMPVHLYGQPVDLTALRALAKEHNVALMEDAAQAALATYGDEFIGENGTACFSLYATKNFAAGEGGLILTDNDEIAAKMRKIRNHGQNERYYHDMLGYNYRLTELNAAVANIQFTKFAGFNEKRKTHAEYYNANLQGVTKPVIRDDRTTIWHQYTIRVQNGLRDALREHLANNDIQSAVYYPVPIHQQPFVAEQVGSVNLPNTEQAAQEVLSLPIHPGLSMDDMAKVADTVNSFMAAQQAAA